MKKVLCVVVVLVGMTSCSDQDLKQEVDHSATSEDGRDSILNNYQFVDSMNIWPDQKFLLAIRTEPYDHKLFIHVYHRSDTELRSVQSFDSLDIQFSEAVPVFEDLNSDLSMDFKVPYGTGGRGSDQFYYLFVQDPTTHLLTRIKNSYAKPNLCYDTVRQTITSTAYWAGTSFVDYVLKNDSLIPTEGVDVYFQPPNWTVREYYSFDPKGEQRITRRDSVHDDSEGLYSRETGGRRSLSGTDQNMVKNSLPCRHDHNRTTA
ncbi:MAG: hypothetical protein IPI00_17950 [Flavobacteriales bacterium]|nr:hypothetical protein [Flavobacteriales bacterium]